MTRYLIQRLVESALVLALMSFVVYGLIGLMPGDPIDLMVSSNPNFTSADAERLRAIYGLDRPLLERYVAWAARALSGDLGYSRGFSKPVLEVLLPRLVNTVTLMGLSFALALAIAVPAALWAASRPKGFADTTINLVAFAGISLPPFWLAILLIILFAVVLGWLPAGGMADSTAGPMERLRYLTLPVVALTLATVGSLIRFLRASTIEALRQDYVRTARAKGLSPPQVLRRHALRNATIPFVTIVALNFGALFSGALITETVFGFLGMGKTIYDAILGNDYNLALAGLLLATATTLVANLLADLGYAWLDPRISYE